MDLLYGDHEGGQREIVRFVLAHWEDDSAGNEAARRATVLRYFTVDGADPR